MPFPSNAVHQIPSHTHTINKPSIYDAYGFRIDPLKEEELEDGEVLCDVCKGYGYTNETYWGRMICRKCQGLAKLDWIERIVGKKEPEFSGYSGYSAVSGWTCASGYMVSGTSDHTGASGVPGTSGWQISGHSHSAPQQAFPQAGTLSYNTSDGKIRISDGVSWRDIVDTVAKNKTINKFKNGFKKLINGELT